MNKRITSLLLLTGFTLIAASSAQAMINLNGKYHCIGNDPTRTPASFTGIETYSALSPLDPAHPKAGMIYNIAEEDNNGQTSYTYHQFGILHDNTVSMAYQFAQKDLWGVQYMTVHQHGKVLEGKFVYWDKFKQVGTERCTRMDN